MAEKIRFLLEINPYSNKGKELTTFQTENGTVLGKNELTESVLNGNNRHTLCSLRDFGINPDPLDYLENRRSTGVLISSNDLEKVREKVAESNKKNHLVQEKIRIVEN